MSVINKQNETKTVLQSSSNCDPFWIPFMVRRFQHSGANITYLQMDLMPKPITTSPQLAHLSI